MNPLITMTYFFFIVMIFVSSFMVAEFMGDFRHNAENYADDPPRIVAHFHEWMAGVGLIMTRFAYTSFITS